MMKLTYVNPNEIEIGDRLRKEPGDIEDLEKSIRSLGLLQPLGITEDKKLVWGWRRLQAWKKIKGEELIPAVIFPEELSRMAELTENLCRLDLPWHIRDMAIAELHRMMEERAKTEFLPTAGRKLRGRPPKPWTQEDTAEVLGVSQQRVSLALQMVEALEKYPELREAETEREALRILKKLEERVEAKPETWTCDGCGETFNIEEEAKTTPKLCPICYADFLTWRVEGEPHA